MKSLKSGLIIVALLLPWGASLAAENFNEIGVIQQIDHQSVTLHIDGKFRYTPKLKVVIPGKVNAKLSDLKPGDMIGVSGLTVSGVRFAEQIVYRVQDIE